MNIFVLTDVLDPYGPISTPKTSNLSIVPIPRSQVIARGRFISHFKLHHSLAWPDGTTQAVLKPEEAYRRAKLKK